MCSIIVTYEHFNDVQRTLDADIAHLELIASLNTTYHTILPSNVHIPIGTNFTLIRQYAQVDVGGYSSICEDAFTMRT